MNSPTRLHLPAPAKLNLFLHVTGRRADGLHLLETVFQFIDLEDHVTLELDPSGHIGRMHDPEGFSADDDLTLRAAQRQGEAAWLETAQHQRYTGPTLETVLQDAIGIPVPVSRLPDWLTDRFQNVEERSADGHSIRARDAGWQIERNDSRWFLTWHQNPQRIEIRLVVDPTAQPAEQP